MLGMLALLLPLHALCLHFYPKADLDPWLLSDYWPMSVFHFCAPKRWDWIWVFATLGLYLGLRKKLQQAGWAWQLLGAFGLVALSNLIHGWQFGLDFATAGSGDDGIEYFQDALAIKGPLWFLRHFHALQPALLVHAKTHPPGPVLLYWILERLLRTPTLISLGVAFLSLALNLSAWRRLMDLAGLPQKNKPSLTLLYTVLPSVMIYYLAVMDAVLAGVLAWALVAFLDEDSRGSSLWLIFWLCLASLLSFGFLFIAPVLAGLVLWRRKGFARLAWSGAGLLLTWLLLWKLSGFNYFRGFRTASFLENEEGFLLFCNPRGYLWYRLGAVLEIAIYLTPFLALQIPSGLRAARTQAPLASHLFWLGTASVLAMLLSGAMKIGEASRICMFLVPYLMLPIAARVSGPKVSDADRLRLTDWVFGMAFVMQVGGFYQW
jgi:hypothetical protein